MWVRGGVWACTYAYTRLGVCVRVLLCLRAPRRRKVAFVGQAAFAGIRVQRDLYAHVQLSGVEAAQRAHTVLQGLVEGQEQGHSAVSHGARTHGLP